MSEYRLQIREVRTGRTVISRIETDRPTRSTFWWLEGNMSCDCNRKLEFDRALGRYNPDTDTDSNYPCTMWINGVEKPKYVYDWVEVDGVRIVENDAPTSAAED